MDDYIKREDVIEALYRSCDSICPYSISERKMVCGSCTRGKVFDVIKNEIPAADVVKVVRCRDCKYWNANLKQCFHKTAPGMWRKETFFCANGERKT